MTKFWRVGESKRKYRFINARCIECRYFQPGEYQHRGAASSGSRATGDSTLTCMQSAYRGCPSIEARDYDKERAKQRKNEGWRWK